MDEGREHGTWPDPVTAERLLRVVTTGDCPADPGVLREIADARFFALLRLLTAAAKDAEIDPEREQAALAAFRTARRTGGARQGRRLVVSGRSAKVLAGGLVAVFAVSGVAVAAGTGVLPGPFRGGAFHAGPLAAGGTAGTGEGAADSPSAVPSATPPPAPDGDPPTGPAPHPTDDGPGHHHAGPYPPHHFGIMPKPSDRTHRAAVRALCRSYTEATRHGGHADPWLIARLQRETGRKERIADYCRRLLAHGTGGDADPADQAGSAPPGSAGPGTPKPTATATPTPTTSPSAPTGTASATPPAPQQSQGEDGENATHGVWTTVK